MSDPEALEILQQDTAKPALAAVAAQIESLDVLDNDSFKAVMKSVQKESGIKGPGLWKPVQVALTGEASDRSYQRDRSIWKREIIELHSVKHWTRFRSCNLN
ncbi:MAG: hypothetical protein R3C26_17010 [Calditrichia bacterium]